MLYTEKIDSMIIDGINPFCMIFFRLLFSLTTIAPTYIYKKHAKKYTPI